MSMRGTPIVAGIALFVIVAAVAFYFLQDGEKIQVTNIFTAATTTLKPVQGRIVPLGAKEYRSTAYRFSLLYPEALVVKEYIEGGNALTVTFQDAVRGDGFQLFITPYGETQIGDERFKQDVPSGVRTELTDTTVDGATGAAFYSENALIGETREIWFIHDSFLFEVTAPRGLDTWLAGIMQTWEFI